MSEIIVVACVGIIIFNARRWGDVAKSIGDSAKIFKKSLRGEEDERPTRDVGEAEKKIPPPEK
jgi:Sec-independent protein translocase protein TatA